MFRYSGYKLATIGLELDKCCLKGKLCEEECFPHKLGQIQFEIHQQRNLRIYFGCSAWTCKKFVDENCDSTFRTILTEDLSAYAASVSYFLYSDNQLIFNLTKQVDEIVDSCFSAGLSSFDVNNSILVLTVYTNPSA